MAEVAECVLEPGVDLVQRQLSFGWLDNGLHEQILTYIFLKLNLDKLFMFINLADKRGVSKGGSNIRIPVEFAISLQLCKIISY